MSKHTPGPWVIVRGDEWTTDVATVEGELPDGRPAHWNVASVNKRRDEWEQNRLLITAAPELLEAAIAFVAPFDGIEVVQDSDIAKARAAIAKATAP